MDGKELVRRIMDEVINKGSLDAADELFADDYVDHGPMGDVPGREAFKELVSRFQAAVPDLHCVTFPCAVVSHARDCLAAR